MIKSEIDGSWGESEGMGVDVGSETLTRSTCASSAREYARSNTSRGSMIGTSSIVSLVCIGVSSSTTVSDVGSVIASSSQGQRNGRALRCCDCEFRIGEGRTTPCFKDGGANGPLYVFKSETDELRSLFSKCKLSSIPCFSCFNSAKVHETPREEGARGSARA